jgi:hypothetical protein
MAFTVAIQKKTVFGDMRVHHLKITADGAEDTIGSGKTGMSYIDSYSLGPSTMATAAISIFPNVDSSGVASAGALGVSAAAANDIFYMTVFGR